MPYKNPKQSEYFRILKNILLAHRIRTRGPISAIRVSSAQALGNAKKYSYWGAVRYEIRLRKRDNIPIAVACERASSDRRSYAYAVRDAEKIAEIEGRVMIKSIGALSEQEIQDCLTRTNKK